MGEAYKIIVTPAAGAGKIPGMGKTMERQSRGAEEIALAFRGMAKRFGAAAALSPVDMEIQRGEFFALVGMNGAGKTTLIKCLLDFCEPDSGAVDIFGISHRLTAARSRLAFLPERFVPPYYLTGEDFLRYMAALQSANHDRRQAEVVCRALDLDVAALSRPVRAYSKGMTQKLGLAACLLSGRELLIMDEPASGLDPKARALLKARLRTLRERNTTLFFTSHSLADVGEICDRMAVLHRGELLFVGAPAELCGIHGVEDLEAAYLACVARSEARH